MCVENSDVTEVNNYKTSVYSVWMTIEH